MTRATKSATVIARMHGIRLDVWYGSGRDGLIRKPDIERIVKACRNGGDLAFIERGKMTYVGNNDRTRGYLRHCGQPGMERLREIMTGGAA